MLQHTIRLTQEVSEVVDNLRLNIHDPNFQELPVNEQRNHIIDYLIHSILEQVDDPNDLMLEVVQ